MEILLTALKRISAGGSTPHLPADPTPDNPNSAETLKVLGSIDDVHRECLNIMPITIAGAKFILNKSFSYPFQVSYSINLNLPNTSENRIGVTCIGPKRVSFPVLKGDIDSAGTRSVTVIHQLTPTVRCTWDSQTKDQKTTKSRLHVDYKWQNFNASFAIVDPNIIVDGSIILMGHIYYAVTRNLSLGFQLISGRNPISSPDWQLLSRCGVARYVTGRNIWSGTIGSPGVQVCYYRKVSDQFQLGVDFGAHTGFQKMGARIGCQIDLPKPEFVFRGSINHKCAVAAVLEKNFKVFHPFKLALSGYFSPFENQFTLGCGLTVS